MIAIQNITKTYQGKLVVDIPNMEIERHEIIGLVGNNGAGKTTLFRLLLDLIRADRGLIISAGDDVAMTERWKTYTAAYLDEGFLIGHLTPEEYFYFCGQLHNLSSTAVDIYLKAITSFLEWEIVKSGKYIRDLSKGNQCKVGIIACLLWKPQLLVLDEPFANLDPSSQIRLKEILKRAHREDGVTALISSHDLNHVTDICTRILVMEAGKIIKDIKTEDSTLVELEAYFSV
jgi:ABC-2 type transport system ATP-binding protein